MSKNYDYMSLPYDLSGSMSKNRFRNELLWGLKKIFDLHEQENDYCVVFDYVCDIEVHLENSYEFYQVKTQNDNKAYKLGKALRKKNGKSVLGKLYLLKYDKNNHECNNVKVALVSNTPLEENGVNHNSIESLPLLSLSEQSIDSIKDKLKEELNISTVSLENAFFVRTEINLFSTDKSLIGETVCFFESQFGEEPKKPLSLYRALESEITSRACNELKINDYDSIKENKGIYRKRVDSILEKYIEMIDVSVEKCNEMINELYGKTFRHKLERIRALSSILTKLNSDI